MLYNVSGLAIGKIISILMPGHFSLKKGIPLDAQKEIGKGYSVPLFSRKGIEIKYSELSDLMMALGDLICGDIESETDVPVVSALDFRAVMLDCSRNAVPTVDFLKEAILKMSLMGMNYFCLYTEDTYEIAGEPLWGYGRGRYTKEELKELAEFAAQIGVTMFPCIQTLGHLEQVLKYSRYSNLRDTERVLNALNHETYTFVEKIISEAVKPYKTNLIHLGMDEAWGIGRGKAFRENTPIKPLKIYAEHVAKVSEICGKKNLKPIIWGDFVLGHSGEKTMKNSEIKIIPRYLTMNYWNYDSKDVNKYLKDIEFYRKAGYEPIYSPGLWNWGRFWGEFKKAYETTAPGMEAVHKSGLKRTMMTMWGDDGNESFFDSNYPSLAFYFAWTRKASPAPEFWEKRAELIGGVPVKEFIKFSEFEGSIPETEKIDSGFIPSSKMLFYDDPLMGIVNGMLKSEKTSEIFSGFADYYGRASKKSNLSPELLKLAFLYTSIISLKFKIFRNSKKAYLAGKRKKLKAQLKNIEELEILISKFHRLYRKLWLRERKPFGLEVIDVRLGGLEARVYALEETLRGYLDRKQCSIPEFELETPSGLVAGDFWTWSKIYTRCFSLW